MQLFFNTFFLFCLLSLSCKSQPKLQLKPADSDKTLLWEISGNGLNGSSYFLGTMHVLCAGDGKVSAALTSILDHVSGVYLEIDMDDMSQMFGALKAFKMRDDTSLSDLLTPAAYEKVKTFFSDKLPMPFSMVERYKPLLLSGMLAEKILPCDAGNGMETILMAEAKKRKLSIEGLETMGYQAGLFDYIPYKEQAEELVKSLDSMDTQKEMVEKMVKSYRQQDLKALEQLTILEESGMNSYLDILLYNRNKNWVSQFDSIAKTGPKLFAVGAGHLPGEKGVLTLLRQKGYIVTPIKND